MYRTITASSQFKIYAAVALAALLMTLLAVTLTASQAQATTTSSTTIATDGDDNPIPQQQGQAATPTPAPHKTPEACPAKLRTASVVDSGYYALFDVWWNDEEGELTNNVCPPRVEFIPAQPPRGGKPGTPARTDRSPSSINITAEPPTIIHIPNSAKVTLSESNYPKGKYKKVWDADDAENPNGDGDRMVWVLPACPPDGDPSGVGLCISYSAALLNSADWNGNIEYIVTHVHQVDIDKQDRRYVLAYDLPDGEAGRADLRWYSADEQTDTVNVAPGGYDRPMWFFPSRGAYEFQVYIRGNPNTSKSDPISKDDSVTSDLREYIVHVGAEADLGAAIRMTPQFVSPGNGNNVTVTIIANNEGPDEAEKTEVDVALPDGLTYSSHSTATGTYANGVWSIGEFASGASAVLTIMATVDAETHGEDLTVNAAISAKETVTTNSGTYDVPVPDPDPRNNTASNVTTVERSSNVAPVFQLVRSVPENSAAGTNVGIPVLVKNPESGDTLTFTLSGIGHDNFTVEAADGNAQIKVAANSYLNYEDTLFSNYDLTLQVSDGKDSNGNDDDSVDDTISVRIEVTDVSESAGITVTAIPASQTPTHDVELRSSFGNPPVPKSQMRFIWVQRPLNGEIDPRYRVEGNQDYESITVSSGSAGVMQYKVMAKYLDSTSRVYRTVESAWTSVTYTD
ncbi:MAG: DUF11 domain-containing protein [Chloroflexi bacterium]|nr:DUF11 domain-containing protein [Chloroflexota bacterium]